MIGRTKENMRRTRTDEGTCGGDQEWLEVRRAAEGGQGAEKGEVTSREEGRTQMTRRASGRDEYSREQQRNTQGQQLDRKDTGKHKERKTNLSGLVN